MRTTGLLYGIGAYAMWGVFPAFFPLLEPANALEILAHRVVWTCLLMVVVIVGSVGMLRLKGYRCAVAASIISCIPGVLLPCFVLSTPCGICALVLLLQSDVKARFSEHQD